MSQWTQKPTILQLATEVPMTLLRLQRLVLLQRLVRAKKQFEMEGVDTSKMFTPEQAAEIRKLFNEAK